MTTPSIIDWLRAALDEDERAALAWMPFGNPTASQRDHIARYDPWRVLAEVQSKRAILDLCALARRKADQLDEGEVMAAARAWRAGALEQVVKLLTEPYRSRPGFREEWLT